MWVRVLPGSALRLRISRVLLVPFVASNHFRRSVELGEDVSRVFLYLAQR
jgi:hypothetical protein